MNGNPGRERLMDVVVDGVRRMPRPIRGRAVGYPAVPWTGSASTASTAVTWSFHTCVRKGAA